MPQDTAKTRTTPTVVAPGKGPSAGPRTRRTLLPLSALLLGLVLLGGLTWALREVARMEAHRDRAARSG
jgi:hypothetical protein